MTTSDKLRERIVGVPINDTPNGRKRLAPPPQAELGLIKRVMAESQFSKLLDEKFELLFSKYKVARGNWKHLAIALAYEHEPGLSLSWPAGRPTGNGWVWTPERESRLAADIEKLMRKAPSLSQREICFKLSKKKAYKGSTPEALRAKFRTMLRHSRVGG